MRRSRPLAASAALALVAALGGCARGPRAGDPAPALVAHDLDGRPWSLAGERGHVVVLDVWATWCPSCRTALPDLDALARRRSADGVRVVAVSVDGDPATVLAWIRDALPQRALLVVVDPGAAVMDRYRVDALPAVYVVDAAGRVRWARTGESADAVAAVDRAVAGALRAR
jgi:thiol-disulfide isomerase/thioredoxin